MLRHCFAVALSMVLAALPLAAQDSKYNDYTWARGLYKEFGFHGYAEKVFRDMLEGSKSSPTERQQGRLGLAEMQQDRARRADGFAKAMPLYEEARKLMKEALTNWPDKTSQSYFDAVFTETGLLVEYGEYAMEAAKTQGLSPEMTEQAQTTAKEVFARAQTTLVELRDSMGSPNPEAERAKWRVKNRAWYEYCNVLKNEALTHKPGSSRFVFGLDTAASELEGFIIENETDDEEAFLGALYGYITLGQVYAALGQEDDAIANISSVLDQFLWEDPENPNYRLHPAVQALAEKVYYELTKYLVSIGRYGQAVARGEEMIGRWAKMKMDFKAFGRAAMVSVAEARLRSGDSSGALALAARVVDEAGGDGTGSLANRLVAEIIAGAADKTRFDPAIIRSAAKGAFFSGEEKRAQALDYFRLFLANASGIEDEDERTFAVAEAWYLLGRGLRYEERHLEAAFAFEEGYKVGLNITRDDLGAELAKYWKGTVDGLANGVRSNALSELQSSVNAYLVAHQPDEGGLAISPGDIKYQEGRKAEREAEALIKADKLDQAIQRYRDAAKLYNEAADFGGPKKERALIRKARTGMDIGKLLIQQGKDAEGKKLLDDTKKAFRDYLAFSENPENRLTDPAAAASRTTARGEARYSIANLNSILMPDEKDKSAGAEARRKALNEDTIAVTKGFETEFGASQKSVTMAVLYLRQEAHLSLGRMEEAIADYEAMAALDATTRRTLIGAYRVGAALRDTVKDEWDKLIGKVYPHDEDWAEVTEKPGFAETKATMRKALNFYEVWLTGGRGSDDFKNWNFVSGQVYRLGDAKRSAGLLRTTLERFGAKSSTSASDILAIKRKLLFCNLEIAQAAESRGDDATAQGLWAESEALLQDLRAEGSQYANYASTLRAAAIVTGGYIAQVEGVIKYFPAQGKFDQAVDLWKKIEAIEKSQNPGGDGWWEAKFYTFYAYFQSLRNRGQSTADVGKLIQTLKATAGKDYGGKSWLRFFDWLERQV